MTKLPVLLLALLACVSCGPVECVGQTPSGFTSLFNGRDLSGWRGGDTFDHRALLEMSAADRAAKIADWTKSLTELKDGKPHWRAEGNVLVNDGAGRYATTEKDYGDFELLIDYKLAAGADSGIYLRGVPQVQIWDTAIPDTKDIGYAKGSGGLWNNTKGTPGRDPLVKADKAVGEWNSMRIVMVGSRVSVWLNQKLVVDHAILENYYDKNSKTLKPSERRPVPPLGPIQLQTHGGATHWRNIFIREIPGAEANKLLASRGDAGFQPILKANSLDGWAGATDAVEFKDGGIVWRAGKAGTLYWNTELSDFVARLQFKVPPGGNNGLAIRYPGTGDPAYAAMTELQVLDQNYNEVKKLAPEKQIDPRQHHGSVYGMIAAVRGYQRPTGEWNFQEVTVRGPRITVELNGTVILDGDVSKVDMSTVAGKKAHPGKDRPSGFFGFAGHNDPVAFKDVAIKKL
jgi:hypothetical protein